MVRPRVWLVPYARGWTYDLTAKALVRHLSHRFEFRVAYEPDIKARCFDDGWDADAYVDMWWHGTLSYRFGRRVMKQVSSHRWGSPKWGSLDAARMLTRYANDLGAIVVPSRRLFDELVDVPADHSRTVMLAKKGFEPEAFFDHGMRRGALNVGWAGASAATDKGLDVLLAAEPAIRLADMNLTYGEMPDFYNELDVIAIGSQWEGDPRPLIEGMACGCFPVATDVGIVPELVRNGENGLIVEPTVEAFRDAFAWCRANLAGVRAAGRENAEWMREHQTWEHVAPAWGDAIDETISIALADPSRSRDQLIGDQLPL